MGCFPLKIQTGAGSIEVSQPRINDRQEGKGFTSLILQPYARCSLAMDSLIPPLGWHDEYQKWNDRSLLGKEYVYTWTGGICFNVRLSGERPYLLALVG